MNIKKIAHPQVEPITLEEAKMHLRVDHDYENDYINALIMAARQYCEAKQNRAYITQMLQLSLDDFPESPFDLPRPPLQSVDEITYEDEDGNVVEFTDYVVDIDSYLGRIALKRNAYWPSVDLKEIGAVKITYTAGYLPKTRQEYTGVNIGTGDDTETEFTIQNTPIVEDTEKIYIDGAEMDPTDYTIDYETGLVTFNNPVADEKEVTADFTQIVNDLAANVPQIIKHAILLLVGHWYENREAAISGRISREIAFAVDALLGLDRVGYI